LIEILLIDELELDKYMVASVVELTVTLVGNRKGNYSLDGCVDRLQVEAIFQ
jgi:hypothetical protein